MINNFKPQENYIFLDICIYHSYIIKCKIRAHDARTNYIGAYVKIGCIMIDSNIFIGTGAIILCNTHIGSDVVIGVGNVVLITYQIIM